MLVADPAVPGAGQDWLTLKNMNWAELSGRRLQLLEAPVLENPEAPSFEGARH